MHQIDDGGLVWSLASVIGALLGLLLWLLMTWAEWRKLGGNSRLGLRGFIEQDLASILIAIVATALLYFAIPSLSTWGEFVALIGFKPQLNFISAAIMAYCSSSVAVKLRNMSRKIDGGGLTQ
jgi:hypothetical protein